MSRSKTARGRRASKALKRYHAKARQIQKKEGGSYLEARRRVTESLIDTIRASGRKAVQTWFRVKKVETKTEVKQWWKRVKATDVYKIKTPADIRKYTFGPQVRTPVMQKSMQMTTYWELVNRTARYWDLTTSKARALIRDMKQAMTEAAKQGAGRKSFRSRDVVAMLEFSDRYPKIRMRYGI